MFSVEYEWAFRCNRKIGARARIGSFLRWLADRLDGQTTLAIEIKSVPPLTDAQKIECVVFGTRQMKVAVEDCVRTAAEERILDVVMKEKHGQTP